MKRTGLAILLISAVAVLPGCGGGDPGQPPVGSISAPSKHDAGPKFAPRPGDEAAKAK